MDILNLLQPAEVLEFATQINIADQGTVADRLFPNVKTQYMKAEYMRLSKSPVLPRVAKVHAYDTEAAIGKRPTGEIVDIEKLLIKEKLNQSESIRQLINSGVPEKAEALVSYIYNDIGNLVTAVKTRADVAKFETLCTGRMLIAENNVSMEVDYGVPDENRHTVDWSDPNYDILSDIKKLVNAGKKKGVRYNHAMTSQTVMDILLANVGIQKAINGIYMTGVMITEAAINNLFGQLFGITVEVNDDYYEYEDSATKQDISARFFEEYKFVMYVENGAGAIGTGLWGATPEEQDPDAFGNTAAAFNNLIYVTRWKSPDPVAVWTKASGVFVPVLPTPYALCIVTVKGGSTMRTLDIESTASDETENGSVITIDTSATESGNTYVYKVGTSYEDVNYNDVLNGWTAITNGETITVTGRANKITVCEVTSTKKAVAIGKDVIRKK